MHNHEADSKMSITTNPDPTGDPTGKPPGTKPPESNPEPKTYTAEEYDLIVRKHDHAYGKLRSQEKTLEELRLKVEELEAKPGKKSEPNDEAVKTINDLKGLLDKANLQLRNATVKSEIRSKSEGKLRADSFDSFWKLEGDSFDVSEDDSGNKKIVIRGMEWLSLDEYFRDELPKRHPYFVANGRTPGTGEPVKGSTGQPGNGSIPTIEQLAKMDAKERIEILSKNPDLRKAYAMAGGKTG